MEAKRFAKDDYDILLIGHRGHEEVEGTTGEAPTHIQLVDGADDIANVQVRDPEKVVWLSQTTLSVDETLTTVDSLKAGSPACRARRATTSATPPRTGSRPSSRWPASATWSSSSARPTRRTRCGWSRWRWRPVPAPRYLVDFASEIDEAWLDGVAHGRGHQRRLGAGDPGQRRPGLARRARLPGRGHGQGRRGAPGLRPAARAQAASARRSRSSPTERPDDRGPAPRGCRASVRAGGSAPGDQPEQADAAPPRRSRCPSPGSRGRAAWPAWAG